MNPIRVAREALGWSQERLAANAIVQLAVLQNIETQSNLARKVSPISVICDVLEGRYCTFTLSSDGIILSAKGPNDDGAFERIHLSGDELGELERLARAHHSDGAINIGFEADAEIHGIKGPPGYTGLRKYNLVQLGSVLEEINFEGDVVRVNASYHRARLSPRGAAFLAWRAEHKAKKRKA